MIANFSTIDYWKSRLHFQSHRFHGFTILSAAANIGLVCYDDQEELRRFQPCASFGDVLVQLKLFKKRWRIWQSVSNRHPVDHSVAIEKNCAFRYFMLSHFVSAILRMGCEIHKCQTTA